MRWLRFLLVATIVSLVGCRKRDGVPWTWVGVTPDARAKYSCVYQTDVCTLVQPGGVYTCVRDYEDHTMTCARSGAPAPAPEAPPGDRVIAVIAAIVLWLAGSPTDAQVAELERASPTHLTADQARDHLVAARVAAATTGVRASLLLGIAWHESNFGAGNRTRESGGRVSCGAMTPEPTSRCREQTLVEEYETGARHLLAWLAACRGREVCALTGYAGGYALIRACRAGPVIRTRGHRQEDLCGTAAYFQALGRGFERAAGEVGGTSP